MSRPYFLNIYWVGDVSFVNGNVMCDTYTRSIIIVLHQIMLYDPFVSLIYSHLQFQQKNYNLKFTSGGFHLHRLHNHSTETLICVLPRTLRCHRRVLRYYFKCPVKPEYEMINDCLARTHHCTCDFLVKDKRL